jgi:hypothetical protein
MNPSIFAVSKKMHIAFAFIALCAMVLAPFSLVNAQAAPTITVIKDVVGTTTPASNFSFAVNGAATTTFEVDGSNTVSGLATGTSYTITEVPAVGFTVSYDDCDNIVLTTSTSTATCTITNTATSTPGSLDPGVLVINKVVVGTTSVSADDFSFDLVRNMITPIETNEPFESDGSIRYELQTGAYTVTEDAASGFSATYANSLDSDTDCNNLLVTPNATTTCTITNTATSSSTTTPATGVLIVKKVVGGGNAATSSFSFTLNGGGATAFEADGTNVIRGLATGTYAVAEVPAANYTPTYSNCTSAVVNANATTTCTITNNFNVGGAQLYEITGIVWDDENEDGVLDGGESRLENWTVSASQTGEITRTDTTDVNGRYSLLVTDGEWLVSQTDQTDWDQTFPAGDTHTVNATGTASTTLVLGDYNFGNDRDSSGGGGGGGGGNGVRIELTDDDDDDDNDDDDDSNNDDDDDSSSDDDDDDTGGAPGGQVLGESTSVFPYGAPDTGLGGGHKMDGRMTIPLLTLVVASLLGLGIAQAIRDRREEDFK